MGNSRIKTLKSLAETKYLNLYEAAYHNKTDEARTWIIASRKKEEELSKYYFEEGAEREDAVLIAALHKPTNRLVVIRQFRVPLNDYIYELPAGLIDLGEAKECSVERELKEETGLTLKEIIKEKSRDKVYLSPGMTDESVDFVYCTCEGEITKDYMEADEDIQAYLISREEAKELLRTDVRLDIKAFMMLQEYACYGEKVFENTCNE